MIKTAFHTGFLTDHPVVEAVRMIRDYGYDAVELNAETLPWARPHIGPETPGHVLAELSKLGPYSAICAHHADFGVADRARWQAALDWTTALMDRAVDLGIDVVHVIAAEDANLPDLIGSLEASVAAAQARGVTLALEPIVNRAIGTTSGALQALETVPGLRINFDPSHLHVMGDDVVAATRQLGPHIAHVHLKDAEGSPGRFTFVPLGSGGIDLAGMISELAAQRFSGVVSVEHESHVFADDRRSAAEVLSQSKQFLDELILGARRQ